MALWSCLALTHLILHLTDQSVHLPSRRQHVQESVMQIIVSVQAQANRGTAEHGDHAQCHLQAGYRVGCPGFPVTAAGHQVEQQAEQGDDKEGCRH